MSQVPGTLPRSVTKIFGKSINPRYSPPLFNFLRERKTMTKFNSCLLFALVSALLICIPAASAAITVTQTASLQSIGTSTAVTITTTSGHLLVATIYQDVSSSATLTVTDSQSQTWSLVTCATVGTAKKCMYYKENSAAVTSVTCNSTSSASLPCVVYEIAGTALAASLDGFVVSSATASSGALTSGSLTTTNANDILLYSVGEGSNQSGAGCTSWTVGGSFNFPSGSCTPTGREAIQNRIVAVVQSGATTSMTWNTGGGDRIGIFAAFANTPITGGCKGTRMALTGVGCV